MQDVLRTVVGYFYFHVKLLVLKVRRNACSVTFQLLFLALEKLHNCLSSNGVRHSKIVICHDVFSF